MKSSTKWFVGLGIVALFAVLLFTGVFQQAGIGGYQILSLSQASIVSDGVLGQSWLVTVSSIPSSFVITGKISASDVALKSGQTPLSDFDIYMSVSQQLKYLITDSNEQVFDYYMTASSRFACLVPTVPDCPVNAGNSPFSLNTVTVGFGTCQTFCAYRVNHGKFGILQASPSVPSNIDIVVSANGQQSSRVTLRTDLESVGSGDLLVGGKVLGRVFYSGDLVNSAQYRPELFQSYKPINKDGSWYFTSYSAYNSYNVLNAVGSAGVDDDIRSCWDSQRSLSGFSSSTAESYMRSCISKYHNAFVSLSAVSVSNLKSVASDGGGIYATFSADKLYAFPQLTFVLDTDWVGIRVLKGVPKINSLSVSQDCTSGAHGVVKALVSNTGSGTGAFDVSMVCPDTDVLTSVLTDNWLPAQQRVLSFEFDMNNVVTKTTKTCTVTAKDKGSSVYDRRSIDVSCNPTQVCTPNAGYCDGQVRKICNAEGSAFVTAVNDTSCISENKCVVDTDCGAGKVCKNGVCADLGQKCENKFGGLVLASYGTKEECSFWCQIGLAKPTPVNVCVYDYTGLIIVIIALIIIVGLVMFGRKPKKGKGKSVASSSPAMNLFSNKNFWRIALVIIVALLLILYFKYIFWIAVGLLVALILDAIFLGGVIRKIFIR